ncbi:MAG TPA: hypothetical protein PKE55_03030 [Kiritimatiellia bacterium]|nr:hypothetical protein [Kiritimatiellia bacterium]
MTRKKTAQPSSLKRTPSRRPGNAPRHALVLLNSSRIRQHAVKECGRLRKLFEKAEKELEQYEKNDRPAYVRWYRAEFGPEIEKIKTCIDEANLLDLRVLRLQQFARLKPCTPREATSIYLRSIKEFEQIEKVIIERAKKQFEEQQRQEEILYEKTLTRVRAAFQKHLRKSKPFIRNLLADEVPPFFIMSEVIDRFIDRTGTDCDLVIDLLDEPWINPFLRDLGLEAIADDTPPPLNLGRNPFENDEPEHPFNEFDDPPFPPHESPPNQQARIKELWRELAFALHPDQSETGATPAKMALWHQAQEAMKNRDLDRLEILHAHLQVMTGELSPDTSVARLHNVATMYRQSKDALRRKIRSLRNTIEWGFTTANENHRRELRSRLETSVAEELREARMRLNQTQQMYQSNYLPRTSPPNKEPPSRPVGEDQLTFANWA